MNNFQTILIAIFLAFFVFGILIFSGVINIGNTKDSKAISGEVVIWGTLPSSQVGTLLKNNLIPADDSSSVKYVEQNKDTYQQNLIEAYAKDKGPDLMILTPDMMMRNKNFIYKIPYASYPKQTFINSFIDGADILLSNDGIIGFPLLVDPLVLYYNKDMFLNERILYPPTSWDQLFGLNPQLTKINKDNSISQSMIAFGNYDNVNHAKDILSMLLHQSRNPIMSVDSKNKYRLAFDDKSPDGSYPFEQIVNYFLEFSNISKDSYSWNRSLPNSFDFFTNNKLALYVGYASELFKIQLVNPNLSYNVAMIPQTKGSDVNRTFGQIYTVAVSKKSKNLASSLSVATMISAPEFLKELGIATSLPTASRSLLNEKPEDPTLLTFYNSAIITRSWFDPDDKTTDTIFRELIENSSSNKLTVGEAIKKAYSQLDIIVINSNNE
jgi:ABC-type glycerol-3-phosphate transport system substrate-binding protein